MKRKYAISVAMATYNGKRFLKEQIDSILAQLEKQDELVISDDGSSDETLNIIKSYQDDRIKLLEGPKQGVKQNFANAISHCEGDYIFLSDQDDKWLEGKVSSVLETFQNEACQCVTHDARVMNGDFSSIMMESFFQHRKSGAGILKNIYKNRYLGCCMAFSKEMKKYILPIPNDIEMHDQWIGILCEKHGKVVFLDKKLILYRRHDGNVSSMTHYGLWKMIRNRFVFIKRIVGR